MIVKLIGIEILGIDVIIVDIVPAIEVGQTKQESFLVVLDFLTDVGRYTISYFIDRLIHG